MGVLEGEEQPPAPRAPFILPELLRDALTGCAGAKRDGTRAKQGIRAVPAGTKAGGRSQCLSGARVAKLDGDRNSFLLARLSMLLLNLGKPSTGLQPFSAQIAFGQNPLGLFLGLCPPSPNPEAPLAAPG